jgi:hypothetical protein
MAEKEREMTRWLHCPRRICMQCIYGGTDGWTAEEGEPSQSSPSMQPMGEAPVRSIIYWTCHSTFFVPACITYTVSHWSSPLFICSHYTWTSLVGSKLLCTITMHFITTQYIVLPPFRKKWNYVLRVDKSCLRLTKFLVNNIRIYGSKIIYYKNTFYN